MLANNDWKNDSRVVREAETLARHGYVVTVFCRRVVEERVEERQNGVKYNVFPHMSKQYDLADLFCLFRLHIEIMFLDAFHFLGRPSKLAGVRAIGRITGLMVILALAVPVLPLLAGGLVLQKTHRRFGLFGGGRTCRQLTALEEWLSSKVKFLVQPLPYLNGFAFCCLREVIALRPDLIHAHDLVTLSCGTLAARRVGCPLVYDSHELETHTNYYSLNSWTKYWIARYEAHLARRADGVITVCDSIADWLASEYDIKRPRVVLNVPVNFAGKTPTGLSTKHASVREKLGLDPAVPLVVYVGSVTIDRGMEECVAALAYLPEVHFATIGPRYAPIEERMKEMAAQVGVRDRVYFVDPVPTAEVVPFIASADCSLMAIQNVCLSYYFAFPNKLLESVVAGLPVVVANLIEMRRFVEENGVGLVVDETDPISIADGVREILAEPLKYRPSQEKIIEIVADYGWGVQERRLFGLYQELV